MANTTNNKTKTADNYEVYPEKLIRNLRLRARLSYFAAIGFIICMTLLYSRFTGN